MDVYSQSRIQLNTRRIGRVDEKVVVFVLKVPREGNGEDEIMFPYTGSVVDVNASCSLGGSTLTEIRVQKCPLTKYTTAPEWEDVLSEPIRIDPNTKTSVASTQPHSINPLTSEVKAKDFLRIFVDNLGVGIQNIIVSVTIKLQVEEKWSDG